MALKIDPPVRERAVRLVFEHRSEHLSNQQAIAAVTRQESAGAESLCLWVVKAEIDADDRDGQTSARQAEIKRLKAENRRLREDVVLNVATSFFAGNSIPAANDACVHRPDPRRG